MLEGFIKYKGQHTFKVKAIDYSTGMNMILSSNSYDTLAVLSAYPDRNVISDRRCNLNLTSVVVATEKGEIDGKTRKLKVNNDFFCRLGSLVRYVKTHCTVMNQKGYVGLELASGEFDVSATSEYIIPYPCEPTKTLAEVTLAYGDIISLKINTEDFVIDLKNNPALEIQFPRIVDGLKIGFKVNDADYLGFQVPADIPISSTNTQLMYNSLEEVIVAHPDKEFSWLRKKDYIIVDDDHLEEICKYIREYDGYVYYDTEATGLNINFKSRIGQADQLVGVVLSVKYGESFFFPTQMKTIKNLCNGDHFFFMEHYMRPILEGKEIVAHNAPFDWKVAYIYDINANIVHDTLALLRLTIGAENSLFSVALKSATKVLLKRDSLELSDLLVDNKWGKSEVKFWDLPYELVRLYACADTDNTNGLLQYAIQADLLNKYGATKVYDIEMAFGFAVAYQEFYGHRLDVNNMDNILKQIKEDEVSLMKQMVDMVGHEFNVNSPAQLVNVLYNEMKVPTQISRKTGRPTTDKKTLERLASETDINDEPHYPIVSLLMQYRQMEGVRKIADKFPERMTPDGFLFPDVQQFGTTTGRVSIKDPNYQSYSDTIKKNIIPRPGFWMFDTDYSSIEYRVLGNMVGNKPIMKSFEDPDFDYHQYQAARMYGIPYNSVTKKMRKRAKGINFGLPYGMGDAALGETVFGERSNENTRKAVALRDAYFKGQEDIKEFFEFHRTKGVNLGYTETYFGRRRYYNKAVFDESAIRRQAGNQVIQGCLDGETLIEVKDIGAVPIKNMINSHVQVWNGETWTWGDVLYSGKKQKCIVIFEDESTIVCSPIHKFLICGKDAGNINSYIECKNLTVDMYIECNTHKKSELTKFSKATRKVANSNNFSIGIKVKSVEITDEWIDMYDVCNTDCGYYVANGVITHNTSADLYKLALGRIFKRICKEGWLGKVMLTAFVHDELLGEVSNEIDPGVFLKVLREEYEAKIVNEDGTPWCPLYMGFGYGMNWYDAKSIELPIKLQWEIVEKYGTDGFPNWTGDGVTFCAGIPDMLKDFEIRDIENQLKDPENQGKVIKQTLSNQLFSCLKEDIKICEKYKDNYEMLKNEHITGTDLDFDNLSVPDDLQDAISLFCKLHNIHNIDIDILSPDNQATSVSEEITNAYEDYEDFYQENVESEEELQRLRDFKVQKFGVYVDIDNKKAYLLMPTQDTRYTNMMNMIKAQSNSNQGYQIIFIDYENNKQYPTGAYLTSQAVSVVQKYYITYLGGKL